MAKIIGTRAIPYSSGALAVVSFFFFREAVFSERPSSRRRRTCPLARTCCCGAPGALVLQVSLRYRGVWSDRCREMSRRCAALDLFLFGHAAPRLQRLTVQTTRSFRLTARPLNDAAKPSPLVARPCAAPDATRASGLQQLAAYAFARAVADIRLTHCRRASLV